MNEARKYIDDTCRAAVSLKVHAKHNGLRVDAYLHHRFQDYSRTFFQTLIKSKRVLVNGLPVKPSRTVVDHDTISVDLPEVKELEVKPQKIDFDIVYEDEYLCAVNKPPGPTCAIFFM